MTAVVYTARTGARDKVCAYCGEPAEYRLAHHYLPFVGFCCGEPTHWEWLVQSIEATAWEGTA